MCVCVSPYKFGCSKRASLTIGGKVISYRPARIFVSDTTHPYPVSSITTTWCTHGRPRADTMILGNILGINIYTYTRKHLILPIWRPHQCKYYLRRSAKGLEHIYTYYGHYRRHGISMMCVCVSVCLRRPDVVEGLARRKRTRNADYILVVRPLR